MTRFTARQRAIQDVIDFMRAHNVVMVGTGDLSADWKAFLQANGLEKAPDTAEQVAIARALDDSFILRPLCGDGRAYRMFKHEGRP